MDFRPSAEINAWPLASVEHFGAVDEQPISAAHARATIALCSSAFKTLVSLVETTLRRAMIAGRAFKGDYDAADPDQESAATVKQLGSLEDELDKLEPFLTSIVEANEQARTKIKTQEAEKAELAVQLAQANKLVGQLTQQLSADVPQEAVAQTQASSSNAAVASEAVAVAVPSPEPIAEEDEAEDDMSLAGDDDQAEQDELADMEEFHQYVLLKDEATMEWSHEHQAANARALAVVSDAITPEMVGCGPDGLCLLQTKTSECCPKLAARIQANESLLLVGASEDAIAKLPSQWFAAIETSELSVLERRAINMALLAPALMFWLPKFPVCQESAQKFMWFRMHLDSLMEITEEDEPTALEHQLNSNWSDVDYLAVAAVASPGACDSKYNDSDGSTTSEDEE